LLLRLRLCVCLSCSSLPLQVVRPIGQRFLTSNAMVPKLAEKTDNANSPSPNTDWLKFGFCSNINISKTHIGTGDDCIAILSGTTNMDISNVNCGPGHGISVGSLGKNKEEKNVNGLIVRDIVFNGTSDGIGIKTWESSASKILVSNFVYENIQMINVGNPINMDQKYCPHPTCEKKTAHVQIQDLKLKNIYGTSTNKVAVNLQCSKSFPCKKVELIDINLEHKGVEAGPSTAVCENVDGSACGKMVPSALPELIQRPMGTMTLCYNTFIFSYVFV
ncbi:unnamed protein product, partial [Brassica oleracea var. botrytis]